MEQEPGVWVAGPDGNLIPDYESTFPEINEGEVVHGTVVRVDKDEVLVDIGYKSEGVIPVAELSIRRSINPADEVSVGDEIDALVLTKEDAEGRLILSKKRARFEKAWKKIEAAAESGEPVEPTARRRERSRPAAGFRPAFMHAWMYAALVPKHVTPADSARSQSSSPGLPS